MNRKSGELHVSTHADAAKFVTITNAKIIEIATLTIDSMSSSVDLLIIQDNFGEPHINDNIFKIILVNGQITFESKVYYHGLHPIRNIDWSKNKNALLMNGTTLYEVDKAGKTLAKHDLQAITGYEDASFQVEYYDESYLVVRPHDTGWLTLIDRQTNKVTRLADEFLDEEKIEIYRTMEPSNTVFDQWDGLQVIERDGDILKLRHRWFVDNSTSEFSYKLSPTEKPKD